MSTKFAVGLAALTTLALVANRSLAEPTELLSIQRITIAANEHLTKVEISTWGVEVVAICHVPRVANLAVGSDIDPGGFLIWQASSWHGELDKGGEGILDNLFLVRVSEFQRLPRGNPHGEYHPASFAGFAYVYAIDNNSSPRRRLRLGPDNFKLTPAARCPDPAAEGP